MRLGLLATVMLAACIANPALAAPDEAKPGPVPSTGAAEKAAVFDFQLANLAQLPPTEADKARLPRLSDLLRQLMAASGRYEMVSTAPLAAKAKSEDLRSCGGCADDYARQLGARLAVTGQIQKVSNLILNINVYIKDLDAKTPEQAYSVDIRGDNEESFDHGIKYLVKHRLLGE